MLNVCNLHDLGFSGILHTYDNKRLGRANVKVRLDRAIATSSWRDIFCDTIVQHLVSPCSDHLPILIKIEQEQRSLPRKPRRHYEIFWERSAELPERINAAWEQAGPMEDLGAVRKGLDSVMSTLQGWSKKKFGNILHELDKSRKKLEELIASNADQREVRKESDHMQELLYREKCCGYNGLG